LAIDAGEILARDEHSHVVFVSVDLPGELSFAVNNAVDLAT
jgi:hypothetical protein